MARFIKNPIVVEAIQLTAPANLGDVGNAIATDWLIKELNGTLTIQSNEDFTSSFYQTNSDVALAGELTPLPEEE